MNRLSKTEINLETILDNIRVRIETYAAMTERTNISELLDIQDELATLSFNLAEIVANTKQDYLTSFFEQKIAVNSTQRALMSQKHKQGESKIISELHNKDIISETMKNEGLAYKAKLCLDSTYKVIEGIRQRVSHLKKEYELTQMQS